MSALTLTMRPLEPPFRGALDEIARGFGFPTSVEVTRLGALVAELSARYNDRSAKAPVTDDSKNLAARLLFSFPRDLQKGAAAVRELVRAGLLPTDRPLRVLDVGAGLGAMTFGLLRALPAGARVDAALTDSSAPALKVAAAVGRSASLLEPERTLHATTRVADVASPASRGERFDVVIAGNVLSELDRELSDDERRERHVALVTRWLSHVDEGGSLVIVEPALRDRTRHLHYVRDALLQGKVASVFAPCLHRGACPMLVRETDWCHEDLPIDLPDWLVPVARAAGLRYEGLTFSYLVLRKDARSAGDGLVSPWREVSGRIATKGKLERLLCGPEAHGAVDGQADGAARSGPLRAMRLERAATDSNEPWERAERGAIMTFTPTLVTARPRVEKDTVVRLEGEAT